MTAITHAKKVLDLIEISGAVFEKSAAMVAEKEAQAAKIAQLIPQVVEVLIANERIEATEKDAAERVLKDPVKCLEILAKTAAHKNSTEQQQLGKPATVKQASAYNSLANNYVGRRSVPGESESDKALKRGLGL